MHSMFLSELYFGQSGKCFGGFGQLKFCPEAMFKRLGQRERARGGMEQEREIIYFISNWLGEGTIKN